MTYKQKFRRGDLVQVAKDLGPHKRHFTSDCRAIVLGSYKDQYGGREKKLFTLFLENQGRCSWYDEKDLTLIERNQHDLLDKWEEKRERKYKAYCKKHGFVYNED